MNQQVEALFFQITADYPSIYNITQKHLRIPSDKITKHFFNCKIRVFRGLFSKMMKSMQFANCVKTTTIDIYTRLHQQL